MSIETGPNTLNTTPRHIHFLGICGTAMGSVAAAMQDKGFQVTGQDENVYPPMSTFLESKGVKITPGFNPADIPAADLIVIGNDPQNTIRYTFQNIHPTLIHFRRHLEVVVE
jgi:UDP-N-acetylmuramate-alanine ligase